MNAVEIKSPDDRRCHQSKHAVRPWRRNFAGSKTRYLPIVPPASPRRSAPVEALQDPKAEETAMAPSSSTCWKKR